MSLKEKFKTMVEKLPFGKKREIVQEPRRVTIDEAKQIELGLITSLAREIQGESEIINMDMNYLPAPFGAPDPERQYDPATGRIKQVNIAMKMQSNDSKPDKGSVTLSFDPANPADFVLKVLERLEAGESQERPLTEMQELNVLRNLHSNMNTILGLNVMSSSGNFHFENSVPYDSYGQMKVDLGKKDDNTNSLGI